ncbi:hypothetical protein AAMO2058_000752200 [Amorphochlora amoebiformis]
MSESKAKENAKDVGAKARKFIVPEKKLKNPMHLARFKTSVTNQRILNMISVVSDEIRGVGMSKVEEKNASKPIQSLCKALENMLAWMKDFPPIQQPMRFGNKAFRQWHKRLTENVESIVEEILGEVTKSGAAKEISTYLRISFGNPTRIDYGTGHELNFIAFLSCLEYVGVVKLPEDGKYIALAVFQRYIVLMRALQTVYWLEPAGSKGVWGLDDYNFIPLLWGAAQHISARGDKTLTALQELKPSDIHKKEYKDSMKNESLYFDAVGFVCSVKTGQIAEHSPIINDIRYVGEVLNKFPIMQHFHFGSILTLDKAQKQATDRKRILLS